MIDLVSLAVGGVVVGGAYAAYSRVTGCTGGHVWGEWEPQDRWRITSFANKDSVGVERKHERECEREGCSGSEGDYKFIVGEAYTPSEETLLGALTEVHYECPKCEAAVPGSERETNWYSHMNGRTRRERCPECNANREATWWDRLVPAGDFE